MQKNKSDFPGLEELRNEIKALNERLQKVEAQLQNVSAEKLQMAVEATDQDFEIRMPFESKGSLEFRIGEYGMAWLGSIVLLFGVVFLIQYCHKIIGSYPSVLVGTISIASIYLAAYLSRKSYAHLSKLLYYSAHLLLFYLTIRLHFVSEKPVISSVFPGQVIPLLVLLVLFLLNWKKKSQFFSGFVLLLMVVTVIIGNSGHLFFAIVTLCAAFSVYLYYRFGWVKLAVFFVFITYFSHLIWLLNNPFVTGQPEFLPLNSFEYTYLLLAGFIFSLLALLPKKEEISNEILIASIIWNGIAFTSLLMLTVFIYFIDHYIYLFVGITLFCLLFSLLLKSRSQLPITASFYAIYGFIALSIVIFGIYNFPDAYLLLSVQSFLVVSMALLFRSRFLVIMNTILFLGLLIFYIKDPVQNTSTDFSFMLVAFITARVMNWKKERLTLTTDLIRNLYLIAGFIMTLIALYHVVPESFITVSWMAAALLFFLFSRLIKNVKYRWLAIAMVVSSAIHLIFADMSKMDIIYRILVFMVLALIALTVSIVYTKHFVKKNS